MGKREGGEVEKIQHRMDWDTTPIVWLETTPFVWLGNYTDRMVGKLHRSYGYETIPVIWLRNYTVRMFGNLHRSFGWETTPIVWLGNYSDRMVGKLHRSYGGETPRCVWVETYQCWWCGAASALEWGTSYILLLRAPLRVLHLRTPSSH